MPSHSNAPIAVALFNDGGDSPHVGRLAVSQAHRLMLQRAGVVISHAYFLKDWRELERARIEDGIEAALASRELGDVLGVIDAIVINGGGTIHHQGGRRLLAILGAAQRLGIPTFLVNAVLQEIDDGRDVLVGLNGCTVRDARSARYLDSLGVAHRLIPDSFFEAPFVDKSVHDFTGRLVITDSHPSREAEFAPLLGDLCDAWRGGIAEYPLKSEKRLKDWQHAVADFRRADVIVTGRHHGACIALKAGVPFVAMPSNTWKVEGLLETLDGYPAAAADSSRPLIERVEAARAQRDWFVEAAKQFQKKLPLPTFAPLEQMTRVLGRTA